jgi:glycerol-3-phosphate dehydrogenase (NAD(P)+)
VAIQHIGVIGAGSWGTALAIVAARAGRQVTLWGRDAAQAGAIEHARENARYLPGVRLPESIRATTTYGDLSQADLVLLVVPAQTVRGVAAEFAGVLRLDCPVVICAKGIEFSTGALMHEVVAEVLPGHPVAVLSGPTFAGEVARGLPTAVTLACDVPEWSMPLAESVASRRFRPYASSDVTGVEIAGALKNVVAIACGIVHGLGLGENARASLITRGLAEIRRLAVAKGGEAETLMGLGGIGDLTLTCSTEQSRNYAFGAAIGRGMPVAEAVARPDVVVEGVHTARAIPALAASAGVETPICSAVAAVLHEGAALDDAINGLLSRPLRPEGA